MLKSYILLSPVWKPFQNDPKQSLTLTVFAYMAVYHAAGWLAEQESTVEQPLRPNTQLCNDNRTQK